MFTAKSVQELQVYTNLYQQIINHPQSFTEFKVSESPSAAAAEIADMADFLAREWVERQDAFERHINAPKVAIAGPADAARIGNHGGLRLSDS